MMLHRSMVYHISLFMTMYQERLNMTQIRKDWTCHVSRKVKHARLCRLGLCCDMGQVFHLANPKSANYKLVHRTQLS